MATVAETKERVQTYLTRHAPVSIDSDGDLSVSMGSARVFVRVREHPGGDATVVDCWSIVLAEAPVTADLYEFVATQSDGFIFGHLSLHVDDASNTGMVLLSHRLLGDYLDEDELMYAVGGLVGSADSIDDDLKNRFGGRRFNES